MRLDLITSYIKEFIAVTDFFKESPEKIIKQEKGVICVEKAFTEKLLMQNNYDTAINKLHIWKKLKWLRTEKNRLTKRIYISELKKYKYCLVIDCIVQEELKSLCKSGIN